MKKSNRFPADGREVGGDEELVGDETFVPMIVQLMRHLSAMVTCCLIDE